MSASQMRHARPDAAVRRRAPGAHFVVDRARDDVARRALATRIVAFHEALARRRRADSHRRRASLPRARCRSCAYRDRPAAPSDGTAPSPCRATAGPRAAPSPARRSSCRRTACETCTSSDRRRSRAEPPSPATKTYSPLRMSTSSTPASAAPSALSINSSARCSSRRAMPRAHTCFGQPVDDLDAGQVALVHGAVERLPGKRLLVDRAVGIAIEKAAELVLELVNALDRTGHQRPREILVGQPLAAFDRVHEMALDRVAGGQRDVVAALDHARAAAFAEQALDRDRDRQRGIGLRARAARRTVPRRPRRGSGCRSRLSSRADASACGAHTERRERLRALAARVGVDRV